MVSAIIVAAGKGLRMNNAVRKQYLLLAGRPILAHTLMVFDASEPIDRIVMVVPEADLDFCAETVISPLTLQKEVCLVAGGPQRQDSVYNGLRALDPKTDWVVIHDGVRPLIRVEKLAECIAGARRHRACIFGLPAGDTVKKVKQTGFVETTLDRQGIWLAQTPQAFEYDLILTAHQKARDAGYKGTDDALLVERMGVEVKVITGSRQNIKITTPEDLEVAQVLMQATLY